MAKDQDEGLIAGIQRFSRGMSAMGKLSVQIARSPQSFFADVDNYPKRRGLTDHSTFTTDKRVSDLPSIVPLNISIDESLPPRLNVILPGLGMKSMSGGPNTAINLTYRMAKAGVPLRYVSSDSGMDEDMEPV